MKQSHHAFTERLLDISVYLTALKGLIYEGNPGSGGNMLAMTQAATFEIMESIKRIGTRQNKRNHKIHYAGAICFKIVQKQLYILCINSTAGRKVIPKGRITKDETVSESALRHAHDEGGVVGEILGQDIFTFLHRKMNSPNSEQKVAVKVVKHEADVLPRAKFRNPTWIEFEEAKRFLTEGRTWLYGNETRNLLENAKNSIYENIRPIRQVGAIPLRRRDGAEEFLLVTSRNSKRWLFPKGSLPDDADPRSHAAEEAREEAGVAGRLSEAPVCNYEYRRNGITYQVQLYLLETEEILDVWKENLQRERQWFSLSEAIARVYEEDLKSVLVEYRNRDR